MKKNAKKQVAKGMLLLAAIFLTNSPAPAATLLFEETPVVDSSHLDTMRGGFVTRNHGLISLGITRVTRIDGILQVTNSLHIPDISRLGKMRGESFVFNTMHHNKTAPEVKATPEVPAVSEPAAASKAPTVNSVTSQTPAGGSSVVAGDSQIQSPATQSLSVQNVPVQEVAVKEVPSQVQNSNPAQSETSSAVEVSAADLSAANSTLVVSNGFNTLIQNSLDQKTIQDITIVDATVVNARLFRDLRLAARINEQLINALR